MIPAAFAGWFMKPLVKFGMLAAVILGIVLLTGWTINRLEQRGYDRRSTEVELANKEAALRAIRATDAAIATANELERMRQNDLKTIGDQLTTALGKLRDRPARRDVSKNPGACVGANGSELSGPDGQFLARESARANTAVKNLNTCIAQYNQIKKQYNKEP